MSLRVAVLGAGIMGSATALYLTRRKASVCLIDQQTKIMNGASRWNEGKIHLGYLYAGDPSRQSVGAMVAGGLAFRPLIEDLIGKPLGQHVTKHPDRYILHKDSVVSAEAFAAHVDYVDALLKNQNTSHYLGPVHPSLQMPQADVDRLSGEQGRMGFMVPEYSVDTQWLADQVAGAVEQCPDINLELGRSVTTVTSDTGGFDGPWRVQLDRGVSLGPFDVVVNALWENRLRLDRDLGLPIAGKWLHRYRKSLFLHTSRPFDVPSRVFAVGPFGDLKNYDGSNFYVSWYPSGLVAEGTEIQPPDILQRRHDREILNETRDRIVQIAPDMQQVFDNADKIRVEGGWVFAQGSGQLNDPDASIHKRYGYGVFNRGSYFSIDTGKYSTAPHMARQLASTIVP